MPSKPLSKGKLSGISRDKFDYWLATAKPGAAITYFTGPCLAVGDDETKELAKHIYDLYEDGHIELAQKRLAVDNYQFIAQKRLKIASRKPLPLSSSHRVLKGGKSEEDMMRHEAKRQRETSIRISWPTY